MAYFYEPDAMPDRYGLSCDVGVANVVTAGGGVIVLVAVWEKLFEAAEDELDVEFVRERLARDNGRQLSHAEVNEVFDRPRAGRRSGSA